MKRKIITTAITCVITAAIILAASFSAQILDFCWPANHVQAVAVPRQAAARDMTFWQAESELVLAPWDRYDPDRYTQVDTIVRDTLGHRGISSLLVGMGHPYAYAPQQIDVTAAFVMPDLRAKLLDNLSQDQDPKPLSVGERYLFLKDLPYTGEGDVPYLLNMACDGNGSVLYLHSAPQNAPAPSATQMREAYNALSERLTQAQDNPAYAFIDRIRQAGAYNQDALNAVLDQVLGIYYYPIIMNPVTDAAQVQSDTGEQAERQAPSVDSPEVLPTERELLVVYSLNWEASLILFYDPLLADFIGFSLQVAD
ncbi:MAG: hypothetical protein ACOYJA_08935 [Christensenellales bacterium]|jgi:hypothetical protein